MTRYEYFFVPMIYNILYHIRKYNILDSSVITLNNYLMVRLTNQIRQNSEAILTRAQTDKLFFTYAFYSR